MQSIVWVAYPLISHYMAVSQNPIPLVNIKIAGKWMVIPLKMVLIGIDPYPDQFLSVDRQLDALVPRLQPAWEIIESDPLRS